MKKKDIELENKNNYKEEFIDDKCIKNFDINIIDKLEKEKYNLGQEVKFSKEKLLRLHADFDNYKKLINKEKLETIFNTKINIINKLLPLLHEFGFAIKFCEEYEFKKKENINELLNGFKLINEKLEKIFLNIGIIFINAKPKEIFDPNIHMAISEREHKGYKDGMIIEQYKCGYKFNNRIISPALVIVNKVNNINKNIRKEKI